MFYAAVISAFTAAHLLPWPHPPQVRSLLALQPAVAVQEALQAGLLPAAAPLLEGDAAPRAVQSAVLAVMEALLRQRAQAFKVGQPDQLLCSGF